eukprot:11156344-Lingulodinium_polyedra.AAC.1
MDMCSCFPGGTGARAGGGAGQCGPRASTPRAGVADSVVTEPKEQYPHGDGGGRLVKGGLFLAAASSWEAGRSGDSGP